MGKLTLALRDALAGADIDDAFLRLATWPDRAAEGTLCALIDARNQLAHPQHRPIAVRAAQLAGLTSLTLELLESLTWLRALTLCQLTKTGYTQSGRNRAGIQRQRVRVAPSSSGRSIAASFELESHADDAHPARIAFRWSRHGPHLVGLWRHVGKEFERGGYWGTAFGLRKGWSGTPPSTSCFEDCGRRCFLGGDPLDEGTEGCLEDCARRLVDCRS